MTCSIRVRVRVGAMGWGNGLGLGLETKSAPTFFDEPALVVGVEENFSQLVSTFVILEWLILDGLIVALQKGAGQVR